MAGSAVPYEGAQGNPAWGDTQQRVIIAAEMCAAAAVALALRGPHGIHTAMLVRQLTDGLHDISAQLRYLVFEEARADAAQRARAGEALAAVPPPRHLHVVS